MFNEFNDHAFRVLDNYTKHTYNDTRALILYLETSKIV